MCLFNIWCDEQNYQNESLLLSIGIPIFTLRIFLLQVIFNLEHIFGYVGYILGRPRQVSGVRIIESELGKPLLTQKN